MRDSLAGEDTHLRDPRKKPTNEASAMVINMVGESEILGIPGEWLLCKHLGIRAAATVQWNRQQKCHGESGSS